MTAKKYLSRAKYIDMEIKTKEEERERLFAIATKTTSQISGIPNGNGYNNQKIADISVKMVSLVNLIEEDKKRLIDLKKEIYTAVQNVGDVRYRLILEKKYFCDKSLQAIADDLNMSIENINKLHGKALDAFKIPHNQKKCQ